MKREPNMAALDNTEVKEGVDQETVDAVRSLSGKYKYGWETEIEMDYAPKGLNEDIVRLISDKNGEPEWMLEWRLQAYRRWLEMKEPDWAMIDYPKIDYQEQYYYAKPKSMEEKPKSLDEVDPKLLETYAQLGIPLKEQMILAGVEGAETAPAEGRKVAVDAVFDSVSVGTTFQKELDKAGVIFCSSSEFGRPGQRQLLCHAELGGLLGRVLCLCAAGRALPDGVVDLLPHQRREHGSVRADADHRGQGVLRLVSRRLHRTAARYAPASCCRRRTGGAGRRRDQVFDRPELVSG